MPRVLFVCRASNEHGLGHLMRARTVASSLAGRLSVHFFALGDKRIIDPLIRGTGFPYDIADDPTAVFAHIEKYPADIIVFDCIEFPQSLFLSMKKEAMTVSLSPIFNCQPFVDLLFHRTSYLSPPLCSLPESVSIRCGLNYAVLRESCHVISTDAYIRNLQRQPLAVAVSMGGVDAENKTLELVHSLSKLATPLLIWVLLGEGYNHAYSALTDSVSKDSRHELILARTTESLWRVLENCSIAILAGGITTYEAAYAGLPSINLLMNPHSLPLVQELQDLGVCIAVGPNFSQALDQVHSLLTQLELNRHELLTMHKRASGIIDGQGADRIATEIEAYFWKKYRLGLDQRTRIAG